jgi:hypothetical protein
MGWPDIPGQYRQICQYRRKTPTQFHDFSHNTYSDNIADRANTAVVTYATLLPGGLLYRLIYRSNHFWRHQYQAPLPIIKLR